MRVVHYQRRPRAVLNHSIEQSFALVREALVGRVDVTLAVAPHESRGIRDRLAIVADAARQPGDLVHVLGDITFAAARTAPARTIVTVLDTVHETWPSGLERAVIEWLWLDVPARRGVTFVAISEFTADRVAALTGVPRADVAVIAPAIDPRFAAIPGLPADAEPMALILGTAPNKNVARALSALAGTGLRACVVGPLDEATRAVAADAGVTLEQHDRLTFDALLDAYRRAHVVLFPSLYEGFGMPIAEAQLAGRPVVTSDRAPMRDTAGGGAWLVDPTDVASIARGVREALTPGSARDARLTAGRANAQRFAPAVIAAEWEALYRRELDRAVERERAGRRA